MCYEEPQMQYEIMSMQYEDEIDEHKLQIERLQRELANERASSGHVISELRKQLAEVQNARRRCEELLAGTEIELRRLRQPEGIGYNSEDTRVILRCRCCGNLSLGPTREEWLDREE